MSTGSKSNIFGLSSRANQPADIGFIDSDAFNAYDLRVESKQIASSRIEIRQPSLEWRDSYVDSLKEMAAQDPARAVGIRWTLFENFEEYLNLCRKQGQLKQVTDGLSPAITYWIILDGRVAVGKLSLHPVITPRLEVLGGHFGYEIRPSYRRRGIAGIACNLGLKELKRLGLTRVFSTCDEDNIGSKRTLEKNGGKLIERYELSDWPKPILKFEFSLD